MDRVLRGFLLVGVAFWAIGAPPRCLITVEVDPVGAGVVRGAGVYTLGDTVRLQAEPLPGFAFLYWAEENVVVSQDPELTFVATCSRSLVACFTPVFALEQVKGSWSGELGLLPDVELERMRLRLHGAFSSGPTRLGVGLEGRAGAAGLTAVASEAFLERAGLKIGGRAHFSPLPPAYRHSSVSGAYHATTLTLLGTVWHSPERGLSYTAFLRSGPLSLTADFEEGATEGATFSQLAFRLRDVPWCCGITATGTLVLAKEGFQVVELFVRTPIRLDCCDLLFDGLVRYETTRMSVQLRGRSGLFGEACLRLYGRVLWDNGTFSGVEVDGFRIRCRFAGAADRPELDVHWVTAFDPLGLPWAQFKGGEFECWRFRFSMPACCGERASIEITFYFARQASLGGLSRALIDLTVPLWVGFELGAKFEADVLTGAAQLRFRWSFAL